MSRRQQTSWRYPGLGSGDRLQRLWLGTRLALWLCGLPVRLRGRSVPALLADATPVGPDGIAGDPPPAIVRMVLRICRLRLFTTRWFPRTCLREALAIYRVLRELGYPARFHIGIRKDGDALAAHSWVTLDGEIVVRQAGDATFRTLYSYPALLAPHTEKPL
jgi:hypothetical protein